MAANDASKPILYWVTLVIILIAFCAVASTARTEQPSGIDSEALKLNENGPPARQEGHLGK